ncbi:fimbrial protein, partial [Escherichia coli]
RSHWSTSKTPSYTKSVSWQHHHRPPANWKRLYSGSTSLHFIAKYRATGRRVTGGIANAQAWFSLTYQ